MRRPLMAWKRAQKKMTIWKAPVLVNLVNKAPEVAARERCQDVHSDEGDNPQASDAVQDIRSASDHCPGIAGHLSG